MFDYWWLPLVALGSLSVGYGLTRLDQRIRRNYWRDQPRLNPCDPEYK